MGMEVYSVAMVALDCLEKKGRDDMDFKVLGTDISEEALATARSGEYSRGADSLKRRQALIEKYTERVDFRTVRMKNNLRSRVSFKQRDIRLGSRKPLFDMVICDHVFQYFDLNIQMEFLQGLMRGVKSRGYLYLSSPSSIPGKILVEHGGYRMISRHFYQCGSQTGALSEEALREAVRKGY